MFIRLNNSLSVVRALAKPAKKTVFKEVPFTMSKILRLDGAKSASGLSRSSIYNMMKTGDFPQSILLGARAVGWLESDVQRWISLRVIGARWKQGLGLEL